MTIFAVFSPLPAWTDLDGSPLDNGELYFGVAGQNPVTHQVQAYWDAAGTIPANQPIKTRNGMTVRNAAPSPVYIDGDFSILGYNKQGLIAVNVTSSLLLNATAALSAALAGPNGSALVSFIQSYTGSVTRTLQAKNRDIVDARDFGVDVNVSDNSAALQLFINACSSNGNDAPIGILPPGVIQYATPLTVPSTYFNLRGAGKNQTVLKFTGTSGDAIAPVSMTYFKPVWSDFMIDASTSSGHAINTANVTGQVYDGSFTNLTLAAGGNALHMPGSVSVHTHSFKFDGVRANSSAGHAFLVNLGPSVTWISCYAVRAGPGKCGYRLAGEVLLVGCNGVDNAETWAVVGCNTSATDGYQSDFSFTDLPRVTMIGCNVEAFSVEGIRIHNSHRRFLFEGGKIDRSAFSTAYTAILTICTQGIDINNPIRLNPSFYLAGSGVPANGANSQIWVKNGSVCVLDESGIINQVYDSTVSGGTLVPTVQMGAAQDVFGGRALNLNALLAARASIGVLRFNPGTFTPVGAGQVLDVTGFTKILVTPAAAASISKATFSTTTGADADNGRNGYLLIEAGNANLTINHNGASAADGFWMKGGANVTLVPGEIRTFLRSITAGFWWEV